MISASRGLSAGLDATACGSSGEWPALGTATSVSSHARQTDTFTASLGSSLGPLSDGLILQLRGQAGLTVIVRG